MAAGRLQDSNRGNASDFVGECSVTRSCEPCMQTNISKAAMVFCKDCNEFLCETCKNPHTVYKPGKHDMIIITDKDSVPVLVDMKGMDTCQEHDEKIKFFCEDHSELCCSTCVFIHRKCDKLDEIASVSGQKGPELHGLKQSLLILKSDADAFVADCKQSDKQLNASMANISKEVDEMKDRIINLFEEAKQKMLLKANALKSKEVNQLGKRNAASTKIREEINHILPMYAAISEHGTPQQKYIFSKQIEKKHQMIECDINEQRKTQVSSKLSLSFPRELSSLLEMGNNFIDVNLERNQSEEPDTSQSRPVTLELLVSVDLPKTGDDGNEPYLTGLDFLPDGRLVAVDNYNKKCIILNDRLQRLGTPYKFKTSPNDVVCVSQNELAVTVCNKTVCLLSVSPDNVIALTREINTSTWFNSICCKSPSNIVVSTYNDPRPARMISMDGVESDFDHVVFPNKTYKCGESMCTYIQYRNTLVLTDRSAHTVYMYHTVNGTFRAITDRNIRGPNGACAGPGDTVLVCSKNNNSIVHLTVDGDILGTYPVDMKQPYSLCVSEDGSRLAVANNLKGTKKLQLYKISPARS